MPSAIDSRRARAARALFLAVSMITPSLAGDGGSAVSATVDAGAWRSGPPGRDEAPGPGAARIERSRERFADLRLSPGRSVAGGLRVDFGDFGLHALQMQADGDGIRSDCERAR